MDDQHVQCLSHKNVIYIVDHSGFTVYKQAPRSKLLAHIAGAPGAFSLPVSHLGFRLLKEADKSIQHGLEWSGIRFSDLGHVAEVSAFLCDEAALSWSVSQLARELKHHVLADNLLSSTANHAQHHRPFKSAAHQPSLDPLPNPSTHAHETIHQHLAESQVDLCEQPVPPALEQECACVSSMMSRHAHHHLEQHSILPHSCGTESANTVSTGKPPCQSYSDAEQMHASDGGLLQKSLQCPYDGMQMRQGEATGSVDGVRMHSFTRRCQALEALSANVQLAVFAAVQLPLSSLMHALPSTLHAALFKRHFHPGDASLDISNQLHAYTRCGVQKYALQTLAPHLSTLSSLSHLDASHNSLCAADVPLVATLLNTHACSLQTLRLGSNFTSCSPMHAFTCICQDTDTSVHNSSAWNRNALQKVLACVARCTVLTRLDLSSCHFNSSCMRVLGGTLLALPALQHLDLNSLASEGSNGRFSTGSFRPLCAVLPELKHLSHLSLHNNGMATHFQLLARALQHMHALQHIDVGGNTPDVHSLACFIVAASHAPQLHALCLDNLMVSCSSEWFFTVQLLQQCAAAFFEVVGVSSSSFIPDQAQQFLPQAWSSNAQSDTSFLPDTPRLSSNESHDSHGGSLHNSNSDLGGRMHGACKNSRASAPFKSLSVRNLTIDGLAMSSLLQVAVLDLAWSHASTRHGLPELLEATPTMHVHAWRLADTLQGLTVLDLTGTDFEGLWNAPQSEFIASLHSLRDLRLSRCNLPSNALGSLCSVLTTVQQKERARMGLTALDWSENPVRSEALQPLCNLTTLKSLRLQGCGLRRRQQLMMRMHATRLAALTRLELGFFGGQVAAAA